jgi:hypothetical protein
MSTVRRKELNVRSDGWVELTPWLLNKVRLSLKESEEKGYNPDYTHMTIGNDGVATWITAEDDKGRII